MLFKITKNIFSLSLDKHKIICYNVLVRKGDAAMAQLVERILGKDEVPGSNPGSSSKEKALLLECFFGFSEPLGVCLRPYGTASLD